MGDYLCFANDCVKVLKPVLERRIGKKLQDIVVEDSSAYSGLGSDNQHDTAMMFIVPSAKYFNTIFMNEKYFKELENGVANMVLGLAHELAHWVYPRILGEKLRTIESRYCKNKFLAGARTKSFQEGFAEYISLDYLRDVHPSFVQEEAISEAKALSGYQDFSRELIPYERGYKFFRKVLSILGEDKLFEVARSPPISEIEMRIPLLYLLRRYPAKGIRNIPKFLVKGIRTKILKRAY